MPKKNPLKRWWVDEYLEFTIETGEGTGRLIKGGYEQNIIQGKMVAKQAALAAKWNMPAYRPVYLLITVNLTDDHNRTDEEKAWVQNTKPKQLLPVRTPSMTRVIDFVTRILNGIVIQKPSQICATMVIKKLHKSDNFIEVFVGAPRDWVELNHDIRNG